MNYWYVFKLKGIIEIDVKDGKNEEEAENKACKAVERLLKEMPHFKAIDIEINERGECNE